MLSGFPESNRLWYGRYELQVRVGDGNCLTAQEKSDAICNEYKTAMQEIAVEAGTAESAWCIVMTCLQAVKIIRNEARIPETQELLADQDRKSLPEQWSGIIHMASPGTRIGAGWEKRRLAVFQLATIDSPEMQDGILFCCSSCTVQPELLG